MRPRISIKGCVRPSIHPSVRPSVRMYVMLLKKMHEIESFMYRNDQEGMQSRKQHHNSSLASLQEGSSHGVTYGRTDRRTDRPRDVQTHRLIEMRGRI